MAMDDADITQIRDKLRAKTVGPLVVEVEEGLQKDMRAMYNSILYGGGEVYPREDLTDQEIANLIETLTNRDSQLGVCVQVIKDDWLSQRPYQTQAFFRFLEHLLENRTTAADCALPTGTGKTRIMAAIALIASKCFISCASNEPEYNPIPVITPSKEIAEQNFDDLCALAEKFEAALKQAESEKRITGPVYFFRVRWIVTSGQLRELTNDRDTYARVKGLDEHEAQCYDRLKKILSPKAKRKACIRSEAFYSSSKSKPLSYPDVLVYNFHKIIEKEEKEDNGEESGQISESDEEEEEEEYMPQPGDDPEEGKMLWEEEQEKLREKKKKERRKTENAD